MAVSDFLTQLRRGSTVDFRINGSRLMRIILNGVIDADWSEHFQETRAIADDLTVIEHETKARFRYPATLTGLDRVNIRNVRLILEGHVVAHPIDNQIGAKINGEFDPTTLEVLVNGQPGWIKWQSSPGHVMVLGEVIELPEHAVGGPARLSEDNLAAVRAAIDHGSTDGMPLTFRLDPDDRLRIWMPGRLKREVLWIRPGTCQESNSRQGGWQ